MGPGGHGSWNSQQKEQHMPGLESLGRRQSVLSGWSVAGRAHVEVGQDEEARGGLEQGQWGRR